MGDRVKFELSEEEIPTSWVNLLADLPGEPPPPPLHPRHARAGRARRPRAAVPDGLISRRSRPSPGSRSPARCSTSTGSGGRRRCSAPGGSSRRSIPRRTSTTSTRAVSPAGLAQAEHRRRPGLLQQAGGHPRARDRDRRRAVGLRARVRLRAVRARVQGLHGRPRTSRSRTAGSMMETWGATVHRSPVRADRGRRARRPSPDSPARSGSRSPRRSRTPPTDEDTHYSLGSVLNHVLLHQTVIGLEAKEQMELAGEAPRRRDRLRRRRLELRRPRLPVRARKLPRRHEIRSSRSSRPRARR